MSIKDDSEKAFEMFESNSPIPGGRHAFMAGAKWMADRCAEKVEEWMPRFPLSGDAIEATIKRNEDIADTVRELAKELDA